GRPAVQQPHNPRILVGPCACALDDGKCTDNEQASQVARWDRNRSDAYRPATCRARVLLRHSSTAAARLLVGRSDVIYAPLARCQWDCITNTCESEFSVHTPASAATSKRK